MIKLYLLISILLPLSLFAQENEEEIPIEEQRNNAIKALLQTVEINKSIYVADDQKRINKFLDLAICKKNPGDFNQGLMEIGALICKPTILLVENAQ